MFLRCRGAPDITKTRSRGGYPLDPFSRVDRPGGRSIAATSSLLDPSHPVFVMFFLFFFRGSSGPFACRNARRLIPRTNCRVPGCRRGRRGWPTRPSSAPARRQPEAPQPYAAAFPITAPRHFDRLSPSSFTRISASWRWSGLSRSSRHPVWTAYCRLEVSFRDVANSIAIITIFSFRKFNEQPRPRRCLHQ